MRGGYMAGGTVAGPATTYNSSNINAQFGGSIGSRIAASPRFPLPAWSSHVVDDAACRLAFTALYGGRIF